MENNSGKHLKKELGVFSGISLVAGMTIGSGIYYLGSYVLERVPEIFAGGVWAGRKYKRLSKIIFEQSA